MNLNNIKKKYMNFLKKILVGLLVIFSCNSCVNEYKKTYRIGIDPQWYPNDFQNQKINVNAFVDDLLLHISKLEKVNFEKFDSNQMNLFLDLEKDKFDAVMSSKKQYNFNSDIYYFSKVFLNTAPVLIIPFNSKYKSLEDVKNLKVGFIRGEDTELVLQKYPNIYMQAYDNLADLCNAVEENQISSGIAYHIVTEGYLNANFYKKLKMTNPIYNEGLKIISLKKNGSELIDLFNRALTKMKKDKSLDDLKKKWSLTVF